MSPRTCWILIVAWLMLTASLLADGPASHPNIVILYADDMGYGDVSCQNPKSKISTPHLDALARTGIRFTDSHSSSGICTPSRYALLTGRYHWRAFHDIVNSFGPSVFEAEQLTLPEMLQAQGYRTACIGKWHLGWDWARIRDPAAKPRVVDGHPAQYQPGDFDWEQPIPDGPTAHGFDYYFGDDVPNFPPYCWIENDRVVEAPTVPLKSQPPTAEGNWEARPGPMLPDWRLDAVMPELTRRAVSWLEHQAEREEPFFLYVPFTSPHAPIVPSEPFVGSSQAGGYGDFVQQTDASVGEILAALERLGLHDNTIVIFSSDNGPEIYALERTRKFQHWSMGELRGIKRDIWEGGHRVPMMVRWPGKTPEGKVCERLIGQIDLLATFAQIVDYPLTEEQSGDSLSQLPLWLDPEGPALRRELVHNTYPNRYAFRQDQWLYLDVPTGDQRKLPPWFSKQQGYDENPHPGALYDLSSDLGQRNNLYEQHPDKVAEMKQRLNELRGGR